MAKPPFRPSRKDNGPRINHNIVADEIRVVGAEGEMLGVMSVGQGIAAAEEAGLDLVEVSPNAKPPVCKVLDFGKYKYEQQKKASEARKKQKTVDVKEVKMRPNIEDHDYGVKLRNAQRFIKAENKVKVTLRFRGREMAHKDIAADLLKRFVDDLSDIAKVDLEPKMEGRQMIMVLSPDQAAADALKKEEKLAAKKAAKEEKLTAAAEVEAVEEAPKEEAS
ncbi:MAG: translation initiation factor IF-3 [Micavibrio sp.]|nr:translation initiation factor IF-3 [Micavibrio sp.]